MIASPIVLALALQSAAAEPQPPASGAVQDEILVIARRNAAALDRCLTAGCPPIDDIKASIAVAEHSFYNGDYRGARSVLARSIARNKGYAKEMPGAVAALYEASSNVNIHFGDRRAYRSDIANRVEIMRDSAPGDTMQQIAASALLGDMWLATGASEQAARAYKATAAQAVASGVPRLGAYFDLRRANVHLASGHFAEADQVLRTVERGAFASDPGVREAIAGFRIRLASVRKDGAGLERAMADLAALQPRATPVLVSYKPIASSAQQGVEAASRDWDTPVGNVPIGSNRYAWVDIGFEIGSDGRTRDAQVLRGRMNAERTTAITRHIASRRYSPFTPETGATGTYRVERYSLRSPRGVPPNSNVVQRVGAQQLEMMDITRSYLAPPDA
ncbi:MAG: hypothetical protein JNJ92_04635 [Altererythrobacter sp.]|nr:hypothetical protein [Altererythrobacter sp.]